PPTQGQLAVEAPLVEHPIAMAGLAAQLFQEGALPRRQDELIPGLPAVDLARQRAQAGVADRATRVVEIGHADGAVVRWTPGRHVTSQGQRVADPARPEAEAARERAPVHTGGDVRAESGLGLPRRTAERELGARERNAKKRPPISDRFRHPRPAAEQERELGA